MNGSETGSPQAESSWPRAESSTWPVGSWSGLRVVLPVLLCALFAVQGCTESPAESPGVSGEGSGSGEAPMAALREERDRILEALWEEWMDTTVLQEREPERLRRARVSFDNRVRTAGAGEQVRALPEPVRSFFSREEVVDRARRVVALEEQLRGDAAGR